jgi:sulfoxide reductase heme-binding subunit YedZ
MDGRGHGLAAWAKHHFLAVRLTSFALCLSPALWLCAEWLTGSLGVNPLNRLIHFTGTWSMVMLIVVLSVSPARRLSIQISQAVHARYGKRVSDWNWLIRLRRQFGLFTFFYALLHLSVYVAFDVGPEFGLVYQDARERPFILIGLVAFALLLPLVATSNQASMRALGRRWRQLHAWVYLIAALAIAHFWMQAKVGDTSPAPFSILLAVLFLVRLRAWRQGERSVAVEMKER